MRDQISTPKSIQSIYIKHKQTKYFRQKKQVLDYIKKQQPAVCCL